MPSSVKRDDQQPISVDLRVLGPIAAFLQGQRVALKGPIHRALLARLIVARGEVVSVNRLTEDLWASPPPRAVGAIRTFVGDLRNALEPERAPRSPARLLVTEGNGYALRDIDTDADRFEHAVQRAATQPATTAAETLGEALALWRGTAYQELDDHDWARTERARLTELRLRAVERRAEARLALGVDVAAELGAHVAEHPWREDGWRLLALSLYRNGRQADALAALRDARMRLREQLGVDPGPALQRLERDILNHEDTSVGRVWADAAEAYARTVGARARLESTIGLLRELAVSGGLEAARTHRLAAIRAAEELGDPLLTARVIGAYDVPAIWTRSDAPEQAASIVAAAERVLPHVTDATARARLLTTIAVESRGTTDRRREAREAEALARRLDDPALLAFALNGAFMQSCHTLGNAPARDATGRELVELSGRHGLLSYAVLGHLIRIQACCALADFATADTHAEAADALAPERPLIGVFTSWYRALRTAATGGDAVTAYEDAATMLDGAGMPGLDGLPELAQLSLGRRADAGPFERRLRVDPPPDLLQEALWCIKADRALAAGDVPAMRRALAKLAPAAGELAAGSGMVGFGRVDERLEALSAALGPASPR
jgi:DNA-binding SARP family transcriptional activator